MSPGIIVNSTGFTPLTVTALAVNIGGTTLTNSASGAGTAAVLTVSGGITGTGNLILNDNNSTITNGITISGTAVNNAGTITNSGTGTNTVLISAPIGSGASGNVTAVTENSATSALTSSGGLVRRFWRHRLSPIATRAGARSSRSRALSAARGNLILNNNSAIANGITLSNANSISTTGTIRTPARERAELPSMALSPRL